MEGQSGKISRVTMYSLCAAVDEFIQKVSNKQWVFLENGSPDVLTLWLLEELLWDLTKLVSEGILSTIRSEGTVSKEHVASHVSATVPEIIAQALGISEEIGSETLDSLTTLMSKEVSERVNASLSPLFKRRVTPAHRLDSMASHGVTLFKTFAKKIRKGCRCLDRGMSPLVIPDDDQYDQTSEVIEAEMVESPGGSKHRVSAEGAISKEHVVSRTSATVPDEILTKDEVDVKEARGISAMSAWEDTAAQKDESLKHSEKGTEVVLIQSPKTKKDNSKDETEILPKVLTKTGNGLTASVHSQEQYKKRVVEEVVESLILKAYKKANTLYLPESFEQIYNRLLDQVWEEIKDEDLTFNPKKVKDFHNDIWKVLCKKWGSPVAVLILMIQGDPSVDYTIVSIVIETLRRTEKEGLIQRFFSSMGYAFLRFCCICPPVDD